MISRTASFTPRTHIPLALLSQPRPLLPTLLPLMAITRFLCLVSLLRLFQRLLQLIPGDPRARRSTVHSHLRPRNMGEWVHIYRRVARVRALPGHPVGLRAPMAATRVLPGRWVVQRGPDMVTVPPEAVAASGGEGVVTGCPEVKGIYMAMTVRRARRPRVSVRRHPREPVTEVLCGRRWRWGNRRGDTSVA